MGEMETAEALRHELQQLPLSETERERYADELKAADLLEQWLLSK